MTLTPAARQQVRDAIDKARRAQIQAVGGYSQIERTVTRVERERDRHAAAVYEQRIRELEAEVDELRRQRQRAYQHALKARRSRDKALAGETPGWWHKAAHRLHEHGFTCGQIAAVFGVHRTAVSHALRESRHLQRVA